MSEDQSISRCPWCLGHPIMVEYHDTEWGVPVHDDLKWFEFITLDGAQAGLSWLTVLKKREGYRQAFAGFDPVLISQFTPDDVERLMGNPDIIRNRLKINSTIINAQAFLRVQEEFGSFDAYIWRFTGYKTIINRHVQLGDVPATSPESDAMSKDLLKRGFKFVGSTICYAFMQAAGMVNDHFVDCHRYQEVRSQELGVRSQE